MTTTTITPQDVPIPAGVESVDDWQHYLPLPYRILLGELRNIDEGTNTQPSRPPQSSSATDASTRAACTSRRTSISVTTASQARRPRTRRAAHRGSRRG
jgi:hypothetical protein